MSKEQMRREEEERRFALANAEGIARSSGGGDGGAGCAFAAYDLGRWLIKRLMRK